MQHITYATFDRTIVVNYMTYILWNWLCRWDGPRHGWHCANPYQHAVEISVEVGWGRSRSGGSGECRPRCVCFFPSGWPTFVGKQSGWLRHVFGLEAWMYVIHSRVDGRTCKAKSKLHRRKLNIQFADDYPTQRDECGHCLKLPVCSSVHFDHLVLEDLKIFEVPKYMDHSVIVQGGWCNILFWARDSLPVTFGTSKCEFIAKFRDTWWTPNCCCRSWWYEVKATDNIKWYTVKWPQWSYSIMGISTHGPV